MKIKNIIFIACFILMLIIPVVKLNKRLNVKSDIDNRMLAEFPSSLAEKGYKAFCADIRNGIEAYLADRIGGRTQMLNLYQEICYKAFDKMNHPLFMSGENGHLYYKDGNYISDFQHLNVDHAYIQQCADYIFKIQNYCKQRGIKFLFVLPPDKKTVYPEYFPKSVNISGRVSRTDLMLRLMDERKIRYIYPLDTFIAAKKKAKLYNKKFDVVHWNQNGAFLTHTLIVKKLIAMGLEIKPLEISDFQSKNIVMPFLDLSNLRIDETIPEICPKELQLNKKVMHSQYISKSLLNPKIDIWRNKSMTLGAGNYKLLVFRDSYFDSFAKYYNQNFAEVISIHCADNLQNIDFFVNLFEPDIVLYETVERAWYFPYATTFLPNYDDLKLPEKNDVVKISLLSTAKELVVMKNDEIINIKGLASYADNHLGKALFAHVGGKYYAAKYPLSSEKDVHAFSLTLNAQTLREATSIEFILISKDGRFKSRGISMPILVQR